MSKQYEKLSALLKELFQTNQADLDFGIYRVINQRRDEINKFLDEQLLSQVNTAFKQYEAVDAIVLNKDLKTAVKQAEELGINPEEAPRVKQIREQVASYGVNITDLENQVYSALYNFFSRYYDEGDFISQRRYKEGVYAIPYEGEEVKLHWANHDQFYIKTNEYFRDYGFKLPSGKVAHFKLGEAEVEKDNRKESDDKKRRFVLAKDPIFRAKGEPTFLFHFQADDQARSQAKCNEETLKAIYKLREKEKDKAKKEILLELATLAPTDKNKNRTLLEKHLEDYTRRNTQDYFIHKDLGKFLRRELDFYIKNEIMQLDNVESEAAPRVEQYLSKVRVLRSIAHRIIDFLAQIENFQKKLWLKKKFVVEANYCITLDRVPEEFYPEIAANEAQREEWVRLFAIDQIKKGDMFSVAYSKPLKIEFLKHASFLAIDTKFFDPSFKYRLISGFSDVDNELSGLAIASDNFQAINLIRGKYESSIRCIHIDPPYNADTSGFLYKNNYRHSSWLSLMQNTMVMAPRLLDKSGSFLCHIDENEYERLHILFEQMAPEYLGTIVWDKLNPMMGGNGIAIQHEYIVWASSHEDQFLSGSANAKLILKQAAEIISKNHGVNEVSRKQFREWIRIANGLSGGDRAYQFLEDDGRVYTSVSMSWPNPNPAPEHFFIPLLHPKTGKPCPVPPRGWSRSPEKMKELLDRNEIIFGEDETIQPRRKIFLGQESRKPISSVIYNGSRGRVELEKMGLDFSYSHPISLYAELINGALLDSSGYALDYFAGSGTTGHAVIQLNRGDSGTRKYILVEMGDHFETVLKARLLKAVYSEGWEEGKPTNRKGISHAFKYIKLESYEDTLNNLVLSRKADQQLALEASADFRNDYVLHYMLDVESKGSLLNIESFNTPFDYQLLIADTTAGEVASKKVDLVETFNYLLGLSVKRIRQIDGTVIVQGQSRDSRNILIIWRNMPDMNSAALDKFFKKHVSPELDGVTDIYVNADNNLANLKLESETWNVHLIEEAFQRLMFEDSRE